MPQISKRILVLVLIYFNLPDFFFSGNDFYDFLRPITEEINLERSILSN